MRIVLLTLASAALLLASPFQAFAEEDAELETLTPQALARLTRIDLDPAFERVAETKQGAQTGAGLGEPTSMDCQDSQDLHTCVVTSHRNATVPAAPATR